MILRDALSTRSFFSRELALFDHGRFRCVYAVRMPKAWRGEDEEPEVALAPVAELHLFLRAQSEKCTHHLEGRCTWIGSLKVRPDVKCVIG